MKKVFFSLIVASALFSCNSEEEWKGECQPLDVTGANEHIIAMLNAGGAQNGDVISYPALTPAQKDAFVAYGLDSTFCYEIRR